MTRESRVPVIVGGRAIGRGALGGGDLRGNKRAIQKEMELATGRRRKFGMKAMGRPKELIGRDIGTV